MYETAEHQHRLTDFHEYYHVCVFGKNIFMLSLNEINGASVELFTTGKEKNSIY